MRCKIVIFLAGLAVATAVEAGPYTPPPGIPSASVPAGNWAAGFTAYLPGPNVDPLGSFADPARALGPASTFDSGDVVALGDGGSIILTFAGTIFNGPGPDFAVFENGFADSGSGGFFGELAWVEVSSNGTNWFRFPGFSATPSPVGSFGTLDPTNIMGLAGTYPLGTGTPYDLDTFAGLVDNVRYVRIIDVIGDGREFESIPPPFPANPIYDPSPTTPTAGGFDLSGVGAVHLAPVPEPSTYALMAAGLVVVLSIARRRRRA